MKKNDLLFVYGTLLRGEGMSLYDNGNRMGVEYVGDDEINGELFNLGPYPGAKVDPGHFDSLSAIIRGEVYRIRDNMAVTRLDAYEGYPHLYNRVETWTSHGRSVWVYTFNRDVNRAQIIISGSWRERFQQQVAA